MRIADLVRMLNITSPSYYNWLHGKPPRKKMQEKMQLILDKVILPLYEKAGGNTEVVCAQILQKENPECIYNLIKEDKVQVAIFGIEKHVFG